MIDREKEVAEWLEYRGLPPTASLKELIDHERGNAALQAGFESLTEINNLKAQVKRLKLLREADARSREELQAEIDRLHSAARGRRG